jgi:hypothetical protein
MKKLTTGVIAAIALIAVSLTACKKTGSSPASQASQMSFQLQADNATSNLAVSSTGSLATNSSTFSGISGLTFTSGIANISRYKLEAKRNGVEIEVSSRNLTNVDLFAASPVIASVSLDTGTYREIEISVLLTHSADTSAIPLKLKGTFTNSSGTAIPIEFDLNDDVTIKSEAQNITVTSTTDFAALIHLHVRKLEANVTTADLEAATLTNGVLLISRNSNKSIYDKVINNFSNCGEPEFREHHKGGNDDNSGKGNGGNDDGNGNSGHN